MNVLGYAQKIGQALMVPVAVLPAAAVLMGIGYWLDPDGWGANSQLAAFLIKSGGAIIDNMGLLLPLVLLSVYLRTNMVLLRFQV